MKYFIPNVVSITDSSINEGTDQSGNTLLAWVNTNGYLIGNQVYHNQRISQAFVNIPALATYSWNNPSASISPLCTKLSDGSTVTPTAVPCVQNVTVVYIISERKDLTEVITSKYWLYTGTTGNVDFTAFNPSSFTGWTLVLGYRYDPAEPTLGNTIYWKDLGATNRNKCVDKAYNSQSLVSSSSSEWWEFQLTNSEEVSLFNIAAQSARCIAYTTSISTPFYDSTISNLLDTTRVVNWRTYSQYVAKYVKGVSWTLPFYSGTITVRIYLMNTNPGLIALGEILPGRKTLVGVTMDGVPIQVKSSGVITTLTNGDIIFSSEGDVTQVYTLFDFVVKFNSPDLDTIIDLCSEMINRRIVVFAENSDIITKQSLKIYGFIRDASPTYTENNTLSDIKIQVQRFT